MSRFEPKVRWWSATTRSMSRFAPARRPHARRRPRLECLEDRTVLSTIALSVNTLADDPGGPISGQTTLRDAIIQADNGATTNQYVVTFSVTGTIDLTSALPNLTNNITIEGPGVSRLTVQRDPNAAQFSVFTVDGGQTVQITGRTATVQISDMTITGGNVDTEGVSPYGGAPYGGGIYNGGALTVINSNFTNNTAAIGGGIYNFGTATVTNSNFTNNSATLIGGGIYNFGTVTVNNSAFTDNSVTDHGGGIFNKGTATVNNCTFAGNTGNTAGSVGGGIENEGTLLTVNNSTFTGNATPYGGGGIYNATTATVTNSTFNTNSSSNGGGIFNNYGTLMVTNSTFNNNSASSGGGVSNAVGTLTLNNTIVAGNVAPTNPDLSGAYTGSNNLIGGNPLLGPLANNGGPTQTMVPLPGSPAIDAGSVALAVDANGNPLLYDQRGPGFLRVIDGTVDIGAVEAQKLDLVVNTLADDPSGPTPGYITLRDAITLSDSIPTTAANPYVITFSVTSTIDLTSALPDLDNNIDLDGPGASDLTVQRDPGATPFSVFRVDSGVTVSLSGMTISGGNAVDGGGLDNSGTLTVSGSTFTGNVAADGSSASFGGGLANFGTAMVTDSTFIGNSAGSGNPSGFGSGLYGNYGYGGGLYNAGTLTVTDSTFHSNSAGIGSIDNLDYGIGGGLANFGTATVTDSTFSNNSSSFGFGGGVYNGGTATVADSTFTGNFAAAGNDGYGGGLYNAGTVTVSNSTFVSNFADPGDNIGTGGAANSYGYGGGIANYWTATVTNCTFINNSAGNGGGLYNAGTLTVNDSTFSGNSAIDLIGGNGGGLYNVGTATVTDSTFAGNSTGYYGGGYGGYGGGLLNYGTVTLTNCTVSGNSAYEDGGGLGNYGIATVTDSTFTGNSADIGGGLWNYSSNYSTATVSNSTFTGNSAYIGGGIYNGGTATVTNSTFTGNSAGYGYGGGIYNGDIGNESGGTATVTNCTFTGNSAGYGGGGIYNWEGFANEGVGSLTLNNTIVAGNISTSDNNIDGQVQPTSAFNLIGDGSGISNLTDLEEPDLSNLIGTTAAPLNPLLGALADNGGPTQTMALLPGSPAIDAGSNALAVDANGNPLTTDQRGLPRIVNGIVNIGAFESSGFTVAVTSGSGQSTGPLTAFSAPLVATVTANNPSEPVAGGLVTFTAPPSGASATLSGSPATINATGTASVTAAANSIVGSYTVSATASGITTPASFSLTNMWVPTFSALTSPTIVYGTSTTTLTGHLGSGTAYPTGSNVSITLNSVTQTASVDGSGDFTTTFSTGSLGVAGGPYTVTYAFAGNSAFTAATDTSTTLTVTAAPLTASIIGDPTKTYDGTTSATLAQANFSLSGLVGTQSFTVTQTVGTYNSKDVTAATTVMASLSPSDFTPGSGTLASNYILPTTASGEGTITPKALTYSGLTVPASKVYDGTTTAVVSGTAELQAAEAAGTGSTADGKPYSVDSVSLTGTPTGTYNSKDVATATTVTFGGLALTGTGNGDYTLTASTQVATITPRTVTASIVGDPTKTYNGSTSATLSPSNFSLTGVISGESFTVTRTAGTYNSKDVSTATTVTASLSAGNFTPGGSGTLASDYTLPTTASGAGNINPALLTVSAANESMTYGGTVPTLTYTYTGLVNGDPSATFSGGLATTATSSSSVGGYAIAEGTLAATGNYTIGTFNPGTLTVNAAPLTVNATGESMTYGGTVPALTYTYTGLVNGDTSATFSGGLVTTATSSSSVGGYAIAQGTLVATGNYTIGTFNPGTLSVNAAPLTITANNDSKTYGTLKTFSSTAFTESGLVNGDSITGVTETSTGAPASATVGTYNIVPSAATGTGLGNYTISYVNGTLTVNAAPLTITANNDSKTYGTLKTFGGTAFTETGLVTANGDTITGVTETSTGAPASATVGTYNIVPSAATGTGLGNYTIGYVNGTLTVNPATLTITANNDSKTYGTLKTFSATAFTETGLVTANGDTITGVTETSTGAAALATVGTYNIVSSAATGNRLSNYTITYRPGTLTVNAAALTITANNDSKTYGTLKAFSSTAFTATGLVNGDTITGVTETSTGAATSATVGTYNIVPSAATGNRLSNYTIGYVNGTMTVNPATLTITANNDIKTYGALKTFSGTAFTETGLVTANGDTITGVTETSTGAAASATVGTYNIRATASLFQGHRVTFS